MITTPIISIVTGAVVAVIFVFFLTRKRKGAKISGQTPSLVNSLAAFIDGKDEKALEGMKALALADKGTPEIYLSIGFLYRKMGDYTKAAQIHEILLGNNDIDEAYKGLLLTELARDYFMADMPMKTLAVLNEAKDMDTSPDKLLLFARASLAVHNFDNAASYYLKYTKLSGDSLYGFYCKCMIEKAMKSKDMSKAVKAVNMALSEHTGCRAARFIKAGLLQKEGKYTKAMDEYKSIITQGLVRDMTDMRSIESAFIASGEESTLLAFLKSATVGNAHNPFVAMYLAEYYSNSGSVDEAKVILYNYLTNVGIKIALARAYAIITKDKIMEKILKNEKAFVCNVCKTQYDSYRDDCSVCGSFDSVNAK